MEIDYDNLSLFDLQGMWLHAALVMCDVSDFKEDEVRPLKPKNPVPLDEMIEKWDKILDDSGGKINVGEYGVNNKRELFVYSGSKWLRRSRLVNGKMHHV